jgi:N-acetyl-gamma-glutamyl-phosphate reductase
MKKTVFVDGQHGTTGLKIRERLSVRKDIEIIEIPEEKRKDPETKKQFLNEADIVFLCLPDDAARESVSLIKNSSVCVLDGSTAHRVTEGWVYGLPELKKEQRTLIKKSKRISVPGYIAGWRTETNNNGLPVSEIEPIIDIHVQDNIRRIIRENEHLTQVEFW